VALKCKSKQHSQNTTTISQNTSTFHKTQRHLKKHYSISENAATAFHKTLQHFTFYGKGIPLGWTILVCDWTEPAREALLWLVVFAASQEITLRDWSAPGRQHHVFPVWYCSAVSSHILNWVGKNGRRDGNLKGIF